MMAMEVPDAINEPDHYTMGEIEVIDAIEDWGLDGNMRLANVIKYVARHRWKNGVEDLKKAHRYLTREINRHYGSRSWDPEWPD